MKTFGEYIEEKIAFVLYNIILFSFFFFFLWILGSIVFAVMMLIVSLLLLSVYLGIQYYQERKKMKKMIEMVDHLEEAYYISELWNPPSQMANQAYYYALQKACKAMNDKVCLAELEKEEYKRYIEMWIHEIKTPISALSLLATNEDNEIIQEEVKKLDRTVEQILFYARSKNVEEDYFISCCSLEEIIHRSMIDFQKILRKQNIKVKMEKTDVSVYTDEKWLHFILNQIIQNSIQYFDKEEKILTFKAEVKDQSIIFTIKDNGIGIPLNDLHRVFDYAFTGSNRKKEHSTGMGLYICKKLANKLGIGFQIDSREKEYTEIHIIFPKTQYVKMDKS